MQVRVENLYFLLSYAWGHFEERDLVAVNAADVKSAEELFARILLEASRRLLRQRLDRGYREDTDELRRPRGKIQVARSVARATAVRGSLECAFDDTTEDVLHNRIIKATARRLATVDAIAPEQRQALLAVVREMPAVADVAINAVDFRRVQLSSNLRRYRLALNVCELLHRCLLPDERTGRWQLRSFVGDEREMGLLFEDFVRQFLVREQRIFPVVKAMPLRWVAEGETNQLLPGLRTDIVLARHGHTVVLEAKCYGAPLVAGPRGSKPTLRSEDVRQLVSYLVNVPRSEGQRITGALLYAVDKPTVPRTRFRLLGYDVHLLELNLNQAWRVIDATLKGIVEELGEACAGGADDRRRSIQQTAGE